MIACGRCGKGSGHWPWCALAFMAAEPVNVHATWCNIWRHPTKPCNCGATS